ncbi:hypothetical protein [Streptomyces sp. NPDC059009]|uniref:hypothetical protein n=1 Tax=Streptomyces sp. NPDC059009 TaxID=3346694 RepID=UPI0036B18447
MTNSTVESAPCARPLPQTAPAQSPTCRFTVTLHDSREVLAKIVSTLRSVPVQELSYAASDSVRSAWATAEIVVDRADAARTRRRLHRMVGVLAVVEDR